MAGQRRKSWVRFVVEPFQRVESFQRSSLAGKQCKIWLRFVVVPLQRPARAGQVRNIWLCLEKHPLWGVRDLAGRRMFTTRTVTMTAPMAVTFDSTSRNRATPRLST